LDSRNANLNLQIATEAPEYPGFLLSHASILANLDSSEAIYEMKISGSAATGADGKIARQLRLSARCKSAGFLMSNVYPFNSFGVVNSIYNAV
jgi:hypothetical protein